MDKRVWQTKYKLEGKCLKGNESKGGRCEAAPEFKVIYKNVLVACKSTAFSLHFTGEPYKCKAFA